MYSALMVLWKKPICNKCCLPVQNCFGLLLGCCYAVLDGCYVAAYWPNAEALTLKSL